MTEAIMFLVGFVISFTMICGGSKLFDYDLDGVAVFAGSFVTGIMAAVITATC